MTKKKKLLLLFLEILIFAFLYSLLSLKRHARFDSFAFDLGIFDQVIWLYSRFKAPFSTIKEKIIFGDHFNPTLILLAPLFWVFNDVRILLIFQAAFLSLSGYPIFLLAKRRKFPDWLALVITGIYLSFFGFQHALNFDFHATVIAAGLAPWLIYYLEKKEWRKFVSLAILFSGLKENLSLTVAALGLIIFLRRERKRGLAVIIFSLIYFFLTVNIIIPHFPPVGYEYRPDLPKSLPSAFTGLFWPKEKLRTWFYSLGWFSFLPLFSPVHLIPVVLDLAQHFLAGEKYAGTWGLFMHYRATLGPFLAWGMIEGLNNLRRLTKGKIRFILLGFFILALPLYWQYRLHLPLNRLSKKYYWLKEDWMRDNQKIIGEIREMGEGVSVAAQNNLVPHLSHREEIYLVWPRKKENQWWLFWGGAPEYLFVDLHEGQWLTHLLVDSEKELKEAVENMEKLQKIQLVKQVGEARLYKILYN